MAPGEWQHPLRACFRLWPELGEAQLEGGSTLSSPQTECGSGDCCGKADGLLDLLAAVNWSESPTRWTDSSLRAALGSLCSKAGVGLVSYWVLHDPGQRGRASQTHGRSGPLPIFLFTFGLFCGAFGMMFSV